MSGKFNSFLLMLATALVLSLAASASSQTPQPQPTRADPSKAPNSKVESGQDKGWDGKVQGSKLKINPSSNGVKFATPVEITFENPADYDAFAAGTLNLSFTLRNTLSNKVIVYDPAMVREGFRLSAADKSKLTFLLVVENPSAPLAEAECVETKTAAEKMRDGSGVSVTLDYAACGSAKTDAAGTAQRPGNPIGNIIVAGGKNPHGSLRITAGQSEVGYNAEQQLKLKINPSSQKNVIIIGSSKGAGSNKAQNF